MPFKCSYINSWLLIEIFYLRELELWGCRFIYDVYFQLSLIFPLDDLYIIEIFRWWVYFSRTLEKTRGVTESINAGDSL